MTIIAFILAIIAVAGTVCNVVKRDELEELEEDLDKYSIHLDERSNKLAAEENSLRTLMKSFSREYNEFHSKDVYSASYTITDSDVMKYTTEGAMLSNAKRHIAKTIADDIIKQFEVEETMTDDGRKRFTYKFKIVKL